MNTKISEKMIEPTVLSALDQMPRTASKRGLEVVPESGSFAGTFSELFVANMPIKSSGGSPFGKIEKGGDLAFIFLFIPKGIPENRQLAKLTSGYYSVHYRGDAQTMTAALKNEDGTIVYQTRAAVELTDEKTGEPVYSFPEGDAGPGTGPFGSSGISRQVNKLPQKPKVGCANITLDGTWHGIRYHIVITVCY